jgi:hypothetical protein
LIKESLWDLKGESFNAANLGVELWVVL